MRGLVLAGLGRYEEALAAGDRAIETAGRLGRPANVVMNYSTFPLREIFALEEARDRSQVVADRLGPSAFNMPWINARADLIAAQLLMDDLAAVERSWPSAVGRRARERRRGSAGWSPGGWPRSGRVGSRVRSAR